MIRILSDLHLFDARTDVRELSQLGPLLAGVDALVLNGDTCETRAGATAGQVAALREFFRARVPELTLITGNHDPDISETHELVVAGGRVWITHGDICFDELTPWARNVAEMRRLVARERAAPANADYTRVETRLRVARAVARSEADHPDRTTRSWAAHLAWAVRTFLPPAQVVAMLRAWRDLPGEATRLAAQRPGVEVVVTGHVHFPRIWRRPRGPTVVNTGSFFRPLGGNLVDVHEDRVEVHRIVRRGDAFHPGRLLGRIPFRA